MNTRRLLLCLSATLALSASACANEDRDVEHDVGYLPAATDESDATESDRTESDSSADASLTDAAPYYPCSTFAALYRSEETARSVAEAWPGRLLCVAYVDDAGASTAWTVSFGSDCKCPTPRVEAAPVTGAQP
jgi:hypothetical protein